MVGIPPGQNSKMKCGTLVWKPGSTLYPLLGKVFGDLWNLCGTWVEPKICSGFTLYPALGKGFEDLWNLWNLNRCN